MYILFADDERIIREVLTEKLESLGHQVTPCADGTEAINALQERDFDVLLLDINMPGANGLTVIEKAKKLNSTADIILLTGNGKLEDAQVAIHYGIREFLTKPCDLLVLEQTLNQIAESRVDKKSVAAESPQTKNFDIPVTNLVGNSAPMQEVYRLINRVAPTDSTVIILGETGTGKELAAQSIHQRSNRKDKPFVAVNCGALPENLIESELFGHRKGSFTGAETNRTGLFEVADGGTLFLDEIGELPKGVQAKLLRFLESGEVRKIGENTTMVCDVRVVCATLKKLEEMVESGEFRQDLWFRINTFEINLPPLRERREDLPELILHLVKRFSKQCGAETAADIFTPEAYNALLQYDYPGNVRQLANSIEHSLILSDNFPVTLDSLPSQIRNAMIPAVPVLATPLPHIGNRPVGNKEDKIQNRPVIHSSFNISSTSVGAVADKLESGGNTESESDNVLTFFAQPQPPVAFAKDSPTLRDLEMQAIESAMLRHGGNKAKVAEELGISVKTLYNKLNQAERKSA
ncbi:acetoacetate metabolism regulatory protein AtoC [Planctomycetales bacterium]|nr:acetoacetate metabolism regulatory protein AtoC [Planctomycetales bacterium]